MVLALYARVSTDKQESKNQVHTLRGYAKLRNWDIPEEMEFIDDDQSGRKESRPRFNVMMDMVRKRKIDMVLVWKFDRLSRGSLHFLRTFEEFRQLGVGLVSYSENFDTATPFGKAVVTILAAVAELEVENTRERIKMTFKRLKDEAAEKGERVPYGRPKTPIDVSQLKVLRSQGLSIRQIAAKLNVSVGTVFRTLATVPA